RGDGRALDVAIRYFNNFVREALKKKEVHSAYDVLYEYRLLARDLAEFPDRQRDIARYLHYYADLAREHGVLFIQQLAAFELGYMTRRAYDMKSQVAAEILEEALSIPHREQEKFIARVIKAKVILGGFLVHHDLMAEAGRVAAVLSDVPLAMLQQA